MISQDKLQQLAQIIVTENDSVNVLISFAELRACLIQEEIVRRIVDNNHEVVGMQKSQRFLFYTLESLIGDVWRQMNTDSLLFLDGMEDALVEGNVRVARAIGEAVLAMIEYGRSEEPTPGEIAFERLSDATNVFLAVLADVNRVSTEKSKARHVLDETVASPKVPGLGDFDPAVIRLAENALLTAFNPGTHLLSTAGLSSYFFDFDRFALNRANAPLIHESLKSEIKRIRQHFGVDFLGILEKRGENTVGCMFMGDYLSSQCEIPMVFIRLGRYISVDRIKTARGTTIRGRRVLLITDNISKGTEIHSAIQIVRESGAVVTDVLTVLFRGDNAVRDRFLDEERILRIHSLLTPEILHFTAVNLIPRIHDDRLGKLLGAAAKEIEERHLAAIQA